MKKFNSALIGLVVVWIVLAVVFAFTDLPISQAIYDPSAVWAQLIEAYAQIPAAILTFVCGVIVLRLYKTEKSFKSIAGMIGLVLITFLALVFGLMDSFGAQKKAHLNIPLILGIAVLLFVLVWAGFRRIPAEKLTKYKPAAKVGLTLMFVAALITVWAFKIPWGRWTYRDILAAGNLSLYTPWYLPQGNNGHNSFFSGHVAMIFSVFPIVLFFKKESTGRKIAILLVMLWGLLGMAGRIVIGAHFASDTLFGACETILWFLLLSKWYKTDLFE
jgi:membrane-associated phospholipid phosphatase